MSNSVGPIPSASVELSLLLDTTVLIDALRGRVAAGRLRALIRTAGVPWICAINVEEVERGPLSQADCLIAAAALTLGVPLATGNPRHFPMPELTVQHWPAGE